ncbi:MAG TPA: hypothetical protein VGL86_24715 [Polyangia bacterium]|jgi:hypothetical protein
MRILSAFVILIALALAGCGGGSGDGGSGDGGPGDGGDRPDLSMNMCPDTVDEGDPCPPVSCAVLGDHCGCGAGNKWTCSHPDMTMPHD